MERILRSPLFLYGCPMRQKFWGCCTNLLSLHVEPHNDDWGINDCSGIMPGRLYLSGIHICWKTNVGEKSVTTQNVCNNMRTNVLALILIPLLVASADMYAQEERKLEIPAIPGNITKARDKAEWLLVHYWDNMDFADTAAVRDADFMEQTFVDFIYCFQIGDSVAIHKATDAFMEKSWAMQEWHERAMELAEKYLYGRNSPMHNDEHYIPFLRNYLKCDVEDWKKWTYRWQLGGVLKNRVGTEATDFEYLTLDGSTHRLKELAAGSAGDVLLIIYNPDCTHCKTFMDELAGDPGVTKAVDEERLRVLAMSGYGTVDEWKKDADMVPSSWIHAYGKDVVDNGLYFIRSLPEVLLLDGNLTVLDKYPTTEKIIERYK